jgi:hypothetical protein
VEQHVRTDSLGDPLPPGAVARIGTLRFRGWGPLAYSPDGKLLASGSPQDAIHIWEAATGRELRRLKHQGKIIRTLAFSPDGKMLATAKAEEKVVRLWETKSAKELRQFPEEIGTAHRLAFSLDGRLLAALYGRPPREEVGRADLGISVWEVSTGRVITRIRGQHDSVSPILFSPDGKSIVSTNPLRIRVWEVATGKERHRFPGHPNPAYVLRFSPDGKLLASASMDGTALVWDMTGQLLRKESRQAETPLKDMETRWAALASTDAERAYQALWWLVDAKFAMPFLQQRLRPTATPEARQLAQWTAELDHNRFSVPEQAAQELEKLAELARPALRQALAGKPTLESRRHLEQLLKKLDEPIQDPETLRSLRAVEALEHIGTAEARAVLAMLAKGAADSRLTQEANASLERLAKRTAASP